jgi:hypothetical protein
MEAVKNLEVQPRGLVSADVRHRPQHVDHLPDLVVLGIGVSLVAANAKVDPLSYARNGDYRTGAL